MTIGEPSEAAHDDPFVLLFVGVLAFAVVLTAAGALVAVATRVAWPALTAGADEAPPEVTGGAAVAAEPAGRGSAAADGAEATPEAIPAVGVPPVGDTVTSAPCASARSSVCDSLVPQAEAVMTTTPAAASPMSRLRRDTDVFTCLL
jgi:hypothetical protein